MWSTVRDALAAELADAGFEVFGATHVAAYNATLADAPLGYDLPELAHARALVLVVGNRRALWPRFLRAVTETELGQHEHPLDQYSVQQIGAAAARIASRCGVEHAVRYSFDPAPNGVAIQRLAVLAGAAELAPIGLCVHPSLGPWLSLRAAVVFAVEGPEPSRARPTCSTCSAQPCMAERTRLLEQTKKSSLSEAAPSLHWRDWLALRDACPVGRDARYGERQIAYHYTKDRSVLSG